MRGCESAPMHCTQRYHHLSTRIRKALSYAASGSHPVGLVFQVPKGRLAPKCRTALGGPGVIALLPLPGPDEGGVWVADPRETTASETGKKTQLRMNRRLSIMVALVAIFALAGSASAAPSGSGQLTKVISSSASTPTQPGSAAAAVSICPDASSSLFGPNVCVLSLIHI